MLAQRITLSDTVELFLLDAVSQGFTANTLRFYRGRLGKFLGFCQATGITFLDDLSAKDMRVYLAAMQQQGLSSAYVHSHARALCTLSNFCVRDNLLESSPFTAVKMPRLRHEVRDIVTPDGLRAVLAACTNERDKALLLTMLDTGVRASELTALNIGDVDVQDGELKGKRQQKLSTATTRMKRFIVHMPAIGCEFGPMYFTPWTEQEEYVVVYGRKLLSSYRSEYGAKPLPDEKSQLAGGLGNTTDSYAR